MNSMLSPDSVAGAWDAVVDAYDELIAPLTGPYAQDAVDRAGLKSGERVLDVAAGTGALTVAAARTGVHLVGTDFSPVMIERLRMRLRREGLTSVQAKVMDGQSLELEDNSFDAVFSNFGLIFFPDRVKGFREMHRVLRPGGRAVVTSWNAPRRLRFLSVWMEAIGVAFPDLPPRPEPPAFSLQDPAVFEQEMREGGFSKFSIQTVDHPKVSDTPERFLEDYGGVFEASPAARTLIEGVGPEKMDDVRAALIILLHRDFGTGPVTLSAEAHIGVGVK